MLTKIERNLALEKRRNYRILTPCCRKRNTDGKFVNYKGYPDNFGYCHSCGKATLPPALYKDEKGEEYHWNTLTDSWKKDSVIPFNSFLFENTEPDFGLPKQRFIPESIIWKFYFLQPENNLLKYLKESYPPQAMERIKEQYMIGSTKDGGAVFWLINEDLQVQKNKVYYRNNGKRTNRFKAPYRYENGYYACLFGAHLVSAVRKGKDIVVLVESEKTAIVGSLPPSVYLASIRGIKWINREKNQCPSRSQGFTCP